MSETPDKAIHYELEGDLEGMKLIIPIGMPHNRIKDALEALTKIVEHDINTPGSLLGWGQTN